MLEDEESNEHVFVENLPIVTTENLWPTTSYRRTVAIQCVVQERMQEESGRMLIRITTEMPWVLSQREVEYRLWSLRRKWCAVKETLNHSIERTASGVLRAPPASARLQR